MKATNLVEPVKEIQRTQEHAETLLPSVARRVFEEFEPKGGLAWKASQLAVSLQVSTTPTQEALFVPRMIENVRQLLAAHQQCVAAVSGQRPLSRAAQYLVNNFEPVEKQLHEISANLKRGSDRALPKLAGGTLAGYPRIYVIARSIIEDTNGCLDAETLQSYFRAYQATAPLDIGELKSVRVMLRLALIEALQRMATSFVRELEDQEEAVALAVGVERGQQADQASTVWKIINSLRWLSTFDIRQFFDSVNPVEFILRREPSGTYPLMEAATRENYCRAVMAIARKTGLTETAVAQRAIELARKAAAAPLDDRRRGEAGYYLIDDGLIALELSFGYTPHLRERWSRVVRRHPTSFYLGLLASFTIIIIAPFIFYGVRASASALAVVCLASLLVVPVSDLVLSILNTILAFKPTLLPKMDFSQGIPEEAQAMVVLPAILSSEAVVQELLETIEAHYLSNQDPHIFFALITDWSDSAQESMPGDEALLQAAMSGVEKLNERYREGARNRFYLFHRRRRWNQSQGTWMGWERKRGKLHEFNQLLRGAPETSYLNVTTDRDFLARVRYIITLDSDTLLPRDAARRLIGTISHPLNRPQLDPLTRRVVHGYGIIQPRVDMPPPAAPRRSLPGLLNNCSQANSYSPVVPNLSQDLFGESNYVGKGLYDVDVFEAALENRIPENSLLSHDLFEGLYARTALATDIKIFVRSQSNYETVAQRQHRWTRGDWQLWPWLLSRVRAEHGTAAVRNVLPIIARWRILDNLRRSLVQPLLLLWLITAWTILPGSALVWTLFVILTLVAKSSFLVAPYFLSTWRQAPRFARSKRFSYFVRLLGQHCVSLALQLIVFLVYLAHQSYLMLDAITRTLYRRVVSGKRLLEWVTAAQVQRDAAISLRASVRYMWVALVIAPACGALIYIIRPQALLVAAPFLAAWMVSPFVVPIFNGRIVRSTLGLDQVIERALRLSGHRMWQTLESALGSEYDPRPSGNTGDGTADINPRCSSPVNLARLLVWTGAAYELGSIGTTELAERLELNLAELMKLQRSTGERQKPSAALSLAPLVSPFILQTENGNLAGHLRRLTQFCSEMPERPLFDERVLKGLADTLSLMTNGHKRISITPAGEGFVSLTQLGEEIEICTVFLRTLLWEKAPQSLAAWRRIFNTLSQRAVLVEVMSNVLAEKYAAKNIVELGFWNNCLARQVQRLKTDLQLFAPWTSLRTASLTLLMRKYDAPALAQWNRINEMLDGVSSISHLPETLDAALGELGRLSNQWEQHLPANTVDRATILDGCARLKTALETALQTSNDMRSRYAQITSQSTVIMQTINFGLLFDEERQAMRDRFPDRVR